MKNKYIVLNEPGKFQSKQNTIDLKLSEGEALVKIKKIGDSLIWKVLNF